MIYPKLKSRINFWFNYINYFFKFTSDVATIAENTGFKIQTIENCKWDIFLDEHNLDRYPEFIELKRFDPNLNQFLAWEGLEDNIYLSENIEWLKHEFSVIGSR